MFQSFPGSFGFCQTLLNGYYSLNKNKNTILRKCQNNSPRFDRAKRVEKSPSLNTDEFWSYIRKHLNKTNILIQNLSIFVNEGGVKKFDCLRR